MKYAILNVYKIKAFSNKYAIFKDILYNNRTKQNQKSIVICVNSRLKTSFINELLLLKNANLYERLETILSIIVRDIVNEKIIDKDMHSFIYIVNINKVVLEAHLYVTRDIKANVILNNNVLELSQNYISLHLYSKQMQIDRI